MRSDSSWLINPPSGENIGYHTFFGTLKFYPMFSPDGVLISQEESERIYGAAPVSLTETLGETLRQIQAA